MAIDIRMPEISADVSEADVVAWLVEPGEAVQAGDVLLEIETEKSTVEIESPATGVLSEILVAEGTGAVAVGTLLARLEPADASAGTPQPARIEAGSAAAAAEDDHVGEAVPSSPTATPSPFPSDSAPASHPSNTPLAGTPPDFTRAETAPDAPPATALARRVADQAGLELTDLTGTGARGRITRADVEGRLDAPSPEAPAHPAPTSAPTPRPAARAGDGPNDESTRVPLSRMRRTIAERLSESKRTIPHFYLAVDCEIDALLEARRQLNATLGGHYKISLNDFIVRATALALREVPAANVSFDGDAMIHHGSIDVAVAVATEGGLITPIVRHADRMGLADISAAVRDLASRARTGKLSPKEYQGGSFSVSNLGMYGIDSVYPIVNPPHSGILGVGRGRSAPVVRDGAVVPATVMTCTLAADHRAVDGAVGAQWLAVVKRMLESPLEMSL